MKNINFESNKVKVLLIGVSKYFEDSEINSIPNVKKNIQLLKNAFLSNTVLNITENDLTVSLNENRTNIERRLIQASREAENHAYTLIVYYAGHGIISTQDFKLYLTASDTTYDYLESDGINISRFREIIESSRAGRKIIILDSCHSGAVHNTLSGVSSFFDNHDNNFEGTYIISSSSEAAPSKYPVENPNLPTYFTGKLLEVMKNGIDSKTEFITLRDIFEEIETSFRKVKLPLPQQSVVQNADRMIFAVNNAFNKPVEMQNTENVIETVSIPEFKITINLSFLNKVASFIL